jgi:hypothetical protein
MELKARQLQKEQKNDPFLPLLHKDYQCIGFIAYGESA